VSTDLWNLQEEGTFNPAYNPGNGQGGLQLPAHNVWADCSSHGYSPRRTIIAENSCSSCHGDLGAFTPMGAGTAAAPTSPSPNGYASNFHNAYMNDPQHCVFCHTTNGTTNGWSYNAKNWMHGIHSSGFRANPYTARGASEFFRIVYPGVLNNCEACHVPGSYDFSNGTNAAAVPNMLWDTVAAGQYGANSLTATDTVGAVANVAAPAMTAQAAQTGLALPPAGSYASPWVPVVPGSTNNYTAKVAGVTTMIFAGTATYNGVAWSGWTLPAVPSQVWSNTANPPAATAQATANAGYRLVSSPLTGACSGCHDSQTAIDHMVTVGGGVFYTPANSVPLATVGGTAGASQAGSATPVLQSNESCLVCHGPGTVADIYSVHMNFPGANAAN
jgi:OmcA/MtrC family decaheme c-type cytochrome